MDDIITAIQAELLRLDPSGHTMVTHSRDPSGATVYCVRYEDEAISFRASDLLQTLTELPTGCPTAEGEDGSLWETLCELEAGGLRDALAYIDEHHGKAGR